MRRDSAAGSVAVVLFGSLVLGTGAACAGQSAASNCDLLPRSSVEQVTGIKFHEVSETKAMPAYDGAWGSNCEFTRMEPFPQGQDTRVDLMIFVESSAAVAKATFDKAAVFMTDHSKPAPRIGDSAYWGLGDKEEPTLHVLKAKRIFNLGCRFRQTKTKCSNSRQNWRDASESLNRCAILALLSRMLSMKGAHAAQSCN